MSVEERVKFLLRTASRVEEEGNSRAADLFRQKAREAAQNARPISGVVVGRSEG